MIKNYLKIAFRNLLRNKVYSFINVTGLSIGLACSMLIILYVKDEVSYDRFHKNVGSIYRVVSKSDYKGKEYQSGNTGYLQGPRFSENVPGIASFVRIQSGEEDIRNGTEVQSQELLYVDSNFFSVFRFPLLQGASAGCLSDPHSMVLSEDAAMRQFGTPDAVNKQVMVREGQTFVPYKVTAVAKRCPQNSSIKFDVLLPFKESEADASNNDNWYSYFLNTFVVIDSGADLHRIQDQMQRFYVKDATATFKKMIEKYGGAGEASMGTYFLQPFTDMHLNPELPAQNGLSDESNPVYSYILSGIALFILIIACINFVNLTVARSVKRAKEIGIRKVVGGARSQLIAQFLGESFFLCLVAFLLALLLVSALLPVFNSLSNKALSITYLSDVKLVAGFVALFLITGILAGFYPALILSGYRPVQTLYGRFNLAGKNYLQKSLVVLQFALASFLIIATFTIYSQFNFLTSTKLGYDDSNVISINKTGMNHREAAAFKQALMKNPSIVAVAAKNNGRSMTGARLANDSSISFDYETIDEDYLPLLKIPIVAGRNFSTEHPSDSTTAVLVNETFVKKAGWKNPLGQTVNFFYNNNEIYQVVGVVKDYHSRPLNEAITPQLFTMKNANDYGMFNIRFSAGHATDVLKYLQKAFKSYFPMSPYSYVFKDQENRNSYQSESKWKQILLFGAVLTIFISCIGLFGLSVLSAEKRTKEIGIRKVLGASVAQLVTILSKDFLVLVGIALFIALPVSWMAGNKWLQNYAYRISLSGWLFGAAIALVVLIALLTVSFQALRAAVSNPVRSLRTE